MQNGSYVFVSDLETFWFHNVQKILRAAGIPHLGIRIDQRGVRKIIWLEVVLADFVKKSLRVIRPLGLRRAINQQIQSPQIRGKTFVILEEILEPQNRGLEVLCGLGEGSENLESTKFAIIIRILILWIKFCPNLMILVSLESWDRDLSKFRQTKFG